jgi:hypothetical protein
MDIREIGWEDVVWMLLAHQRPVAGFCEHNNGLLFPIKGGEFLDQLRDYQFLKD